VLTLVLPADGCGSGSPSSNGEAAKSGAQVYNDAKQAATGASSVHISGTFTDAGKTVKLDLVVGAVASKGFMAQDSARADIARVGNIDYMRASTDFWRKFAGATASAGAARQVAQRAPPRSSRSARSRSSCRSTRFGRTFRGMAS
jgi:hypothetical protein